MYVTYEQFGVDLTGVNASDTQMKACHDFANTHGLKVIQKSGVVRWQNLPIEVKTDCDLAGLKVILGPTSGSTISAYSHPAVFHIARTAPPIELCATEIANLVVNHSDEIKKGSQRISHPDFIARPNCLAVIRGSFMDIMRNGTTPIKAQAVIFLGRAGNFVGVLDRDFTQGIESVRFYPREESRLTFKPPCFELDGVVSVCCVLIERNQTTLTGFVSKEIGTPMTTIRQLVTVRDCYDVCLDDMETEAQAPGPSGSYGLRVDSVYDLRVRGMRGFGGWGVTGTNYMIKALFEDCCINRFDAHWMGYDIDLSRCELVNRGCNVAGGGYFRAINCTMVITDYDNTIDGIGPFFDVKTDYGCEFDGLVVVRDLVVRIGEGYGLANVSGTTNLTVVRIGNPISYNPGREVWLPQLVRIDGVTVIAPPSLGSEQPFTLTGVQKNIASTLSGHAVHAPTLDRLYVASLGYLHPVVGRDLRTRVTLGI